MGTLHHFRRRRRAAVGANRGALTIACAAVFLGVFTVGLLEPQFRTSVAGSGAPARVTRVIDGDTLVIAGGERVRIENIDTAELPPASRCEAEATLALAARGRLRALVEGQLVHLQTSGRDRDPFGRLLRRVSLDGRDVGLILVEEGLARRWRGRRADWC